MHWSCKGKEKSLYLGGSTRERTKQIKFTAQDNECHSKGMRIQPWENRVQRTDKRRLREILGEVMVWIKIKKHRERLSSHVF